jgi:hypothetical protein
MLFPHTIFFSNRFLSFTSLCESSIGSVSFSDIYAFTIATQKWSNVVSTSSVMRHGHGANIDNRNMIYYFGGNSSSRFCFLLCFFILMHLLTVLSTNFLFNHNEVTATTSCQ